MNVQTLKVSKNTQLGAKGLDIPLMDGEFNANESRNLMLNLLLDLQEYYRRHQFSQIEKFGISDLGAEKMALEMASCFEQAKAMVKEAEDREEILNIRCHLKVEFVKPAEAQANTQLPPQYSKSEIQRLARA